MIRQQFDRLSKIVQDLLFRVSDHRVVCGEAADGQTAIHKVGELLPDVLLLDLLLPVITGLRVAQTVKQDHPLVRIVIMSAEDASTNAGAGQGSRYSLCNIEISAD